MKENIAKAVTYTNRFVQSDWFILLNAALIFIGWVSGGWIPVLCVVTVLNLLPLFIGRETKHLLCLLTMFTFVISANRHALNNFAPLLSLIVVLLAAIIFSLVRFKRDWSVLHITRIKGFHLSFIALIIPFAFGGVGSPYEHPLAVLAALGIVLVMALGYTFMYVTNRTSEQKEKFPEYMLKILFAAGIVVSLELIVYFARLGGIENIKAAILSKEIHLGWAGKNNVAPIIAMCIPASLYFCINKSKFLTPLFTLIALLQYALLLTTGCRGAILFATLALPAMLFYTIVKSQNKIAFGVTVCAVFVVAIILVAYFGEFVSDVVDTIIGRGFDSAGRTDGLYPLAWETFKRWPIFGAGWDYRLGELASSNYTPYWYHSTALQIIATMGLVGAIAFIFFYFWRYRSLLVLRKNPAFVALLASLLLFDAYGMIDTNFFGPTFFLILLCISLTADVCLPENKCRAFGGRNPFADIAAGCKRLSAAVKAKKQNVNSAQEHDDFDQKDGITADKDGVLPAEANPENASENEEL